MIKKKLFAALIYVFIFCNASVAFDPNWQISVEQDYASLYRKYSNSTLDYLVNNIQSQAVSVKNINYYNATKINNLPFFLKYLLSTEIILKMGRANMEFDYEYKTDHVTFNINDNGFLGYGAACSFQWNDDWSTRLMATINYGNIDNKSLNWEATRAGYTCAQKIKGSWRSITSDIETKYKNNNIQYLFGILTPSSLDNITYYNFPGRPTTYEATGSFSVYQSYLYLGVELPFMESFNLLSKVGLPLGRNSSLGYLINLNYGF